MWFESLPNTCQVACGVYQGGCPVEALQKASIYEAAYSGEAKNWRDLVDNDTIYFCSFEIAPLKLFTSIELVTQTTKSVSKSFLCHLYSHCQTATHAPTKDECDTLKRVHQNRVGEEKCLNTIRRSYFRILQKDK